MDMKNFLITLTIILFLSFPAFAEYSKLVEDMPLMPKMQEQKEDFVVFDNPTGRIMQFSAITSASKKEILKFYSEALPPLGWKKLSENSFIRETETIKLEIENGANQSTVLFTIISK